MARQLGTFADKLSDTIGMRLAPGTQRHEGGVDPPRLTLSQPAFALVRGHADAGFSMRDSSAVKTGPTDCNATELRCSGNFVSSRETGCRERELVTGDVSCSSQQSGLGTQVALASSKNLCKTLPTHRTDEN